MTAVHTAIRPEALSADECLAAVRLPGAGGLALFVGTVRDRDAGRTVTALEYTAHPAAAEVLRTVAGEIAASDAVHAVAAVHRSGLLAIGDIAVICAVSAAHRGEAFDACRRLIDELKARVPIWKRQVFADGTEEWVGTP